MKFATRLLIATLSYAACATPAHADAFDEIIKNAAKRNGLVPAQSLFVSTDADLVDEGRILFESNSLSLNGNIACKTCHLHKFGSADGIPNAVAIFGEGEGPARALRGGPLLPRNTLPFWGRGAKGFDTFFWDGKVDFSSSSPKSQFGNSNPSPDPLVTAVHLPVVEIREMLDEDKFISANKTESVKAAQNVYKAIVQKIKSDEPLAAASLQRKLSVSSDELSFGHLARAIAAFIRHEFRLRDTKFHDYVFGNKSLSKEEKNGALIFYGKGKCITCHNGPHYSDFQFHAVPFPQLGFGKNGFGVDYGRFNVSFEPNDIYRFRTPPLFNVAKTGPYGHSGSIDTIEKSITAHFDPLSLIEPSRLSPMDRHEMFKRMSAAGDITQLLSYLSPVEVRDIAAFLQTLSFEVPASERTVQ